MLLLKTECWKAAKFCIVYRLPQGGNIISVLGETGVDFPISLVLQGEVNGNYFLLSKGCYVLGSHLEIIF